MEFKNTKKQGDAGLGAAISYFTLYGYTVSIPLTDSQDYDLIVDIGNSLYRVQVKTTTYKIRDVYSVSLTIKGGNRTSIGSKIKKLDDTKVDAIFILTGSQDKYFIPLKDIEARSNINLGSGYDKFRL